MGFLQPTPPPFDLEEWRAKPYLTRLKMNCQDWAVNGFAPPTAVYLLYAIKLVLFLFFAGLVVSATTPGVGGLGDIGHWWFKPIVFQKFVVWTALWEIIGLGSGSMQLAARYGPVIGGAVYWLRPGTVRLPPWPDKVPLTRGNRRAVVDALLYGGVLVTCVHALIAGGDNGLMSHTDIVMILAFWAVLGLRDKVPFLAARPEIYGFFLIVSLFPLKNILPGWQFVMFFIWWGAATSKLNRHFPYVISVMVSNTPWNRSRTAKSKLFKDYPNDLRPGRAAAMGAHLGTAVEFGLPLVLLLTNKGPIHTAALVGMIIFHVHITSTFALGVPLEWNLFMIYSLCFNFGHYANVPLSNVDNPLLIAVLALIGIVIPVIGNLFPEKVSFLPSMRYYAGNWATSIWLFRKDTDAEGKFDERVFKIARVTVEQLAKLYGPEMANYFMDKALAFRSMHSHGRALNALSARAVDDVEDYFVREGEVIAGVVAGWNFGDGHFHHEQLLEAVQEQAGFVPGDVRVIMLESQPFHIPRQRYRIHDAADGLLEEGWVDVAEMVKRGPWLEESFEFPVEVLRSNRAAVA
ncbi:MAG TPA: DUF3556 domain-containing protein [Thermoleophilaceae bacterium]|jgi:hypothetical protein|nr:DUF3556 domain-containing protein [Thermoleophilaceae bacterium]